MTDFDSPRASEQAVIGAVVISGGEALDLITLNADDFESPAYAAIFVAASEMHADGQPVDQYLLMDTLPQHATLIGDAADVTFSWANVAFYAEKVATHALRRRLRDAGRAIIEMSTSEDTDPAALPDLTRSALDRSIGATREAPLASLRERFDVVLRQLEERPEVVPTPWPRINAALNGGLRHGGFYVIGARPGVGKSVVALQLAHALSLKGPVLFSSLEMEEKEIVARLWAQQCQIPFSRVMANTMSDFMWERLMTWRATDPMSIVFDDTPGVSVFDIRNRARSMHRQRPLAGVVVDYLQLMEDDRDIKRWEKVAEMTRRLKLLSRELQVPVIACSQLNRESSRRGDGRPGLSDLRESGSIEQDADVVMLLDRDTSDPDSDLAVNLAKNRQGQTGITYLSWEGTFVRAVDAG